MEPLHAGDLVKVTTAGPTVDAIVFELPSETKVVVAVVDPKKGPVLRTVGIETVSERAEDGPQDPALHALIRRTPSTARGGRSGANGPVQGRRGHTRASMHRTTGK
jgi:hypothetical protein